MKCRSFKFSSFGQFAFCVAQSTLRSQRKSTTILFEHYLSSARKPLLTSIGSVGINLFCQRRQGRNMEGLCFRSFHESRYQMYVCLVLKRSHVHLPEDLPCLS